MRSNLLVLLALAAGVGGWFGRQAIGEDAGAPPGMPSPEDMAKLEKMIQELATPGEPHKMLASQEGDWNVAVKALDHKTGQMVDSTGTATMRMILGGRWQEHTFRGTFDGKPFEGRGLTGYDNHKKEFVNYWFDTMGTGASVATGQCSEDHKVLTMTGTWEMPEPLGKMPFRMVTTRKSDTEFTFAAYSSAMGMPESLMMEMTYTRK
jgi:hypothetical protein